jgi:hypothetical protein
LLKLAVASERKKFYEISSVAGWVIKKIDGEILRVLLETGGQNTAIRWLCFDASAF